MFHECYLIDRALEKEPAKRKKAGLGEVSSPVTISVAGMIRCSEAGLVLPFFAGEPTSYGPETCPDPESLEERVRHQACDATVAMQEWVNPQEAMVNRPHRLNLAQLAQWGRCVRSVEAHQETRHVRMRRWHVSANCDVKLTQLAGNDFMAFAGVLIFDPKHVGRQVLAKLLMKPTGIGGRGGQCGGVTTFVNQLLGVDVGHGFESEITYFLFAPKGIRQGVFNVLGVGAVTFDEV